MFTSSELGYGVPPGRVTHCSKDQLTLAHSRCASVGRHGRDDTLIARAVSCSDFRDSSLIARGGLGSGEQGCGMDAPPLVGHMMHSVRTVLLCCCRHAPAASQCPPAPEPRACLLSRCLVDYLSHGATGAVRLERYGRQGWQVLPTCRNCHCRVHSSSPGPQYTTTDLCVWLWSAV